jgi:translation initiation factor IF-2
LPTVGAECRAFETKQEAEAYCAERATEKAALVQPSAINETEDDGETVVIPLIIKADTLGSADAIQFELTKQAFEYVRFLIIKSEVGSISEADVKFAQSVEGCVIVGFNVSTETQARAALERTKIPTQTFSIIYEVTAWLKTVATERRPHLTEEVIRGRAKILKIFNKNKHLHIIGAKVKEGTIHKNHTVTIVRRDEPIGTGTIKELQQAKSQANSISAGSEFGAAVDSKIELAEGDTLQDIETVQK